LTFDDGPCRYTDELLETLKQRGVHATFFMLGSHAKGQPERVRRVAAEGHEVASHTYSHKQLTRLSAEGQCAQLENAHNVFKELGVDVHYVRPPYGSYNKTTLDEAERLGLKVVIWSVDSYDWRHPLTIEGLVSSHGHDRATNGVFLFHDIHKSTVDRIPLLIDHLEAAQCKFVTLSEYMAYASAAEPSADPQQTTPGSEKQPDSSEGGKQGTDQHPDGTLTPQPQKQETPRQNVNEPEEVEEFGEEENVAELQGPLSPMDSAAENGSVQSCPTDVRKDKSPKAFFHWLFTKYWG
ncbi:MAG: polysaccharide deacetylase family protein, partial [Desulfovibrionaceae bacterium]|nr:polysaccharide deacetylase family protein [Desulfovibrionaceae bacterium]